LARLIHDIGKVSVPAEILCNPNKLSIDEFNIIKMHPTLGYEILKGLELPWPIAQIIHQHHERIDGSGYPLGLSGKDILLEARILAVADVVEVMASHRPYRASLGLDRALHEIIRHRGKLYDSKAVDACLKVFRELAFEFRDDIEELSPTRILLAPATRR
jgi:HD-GYP domain-containing protein (c-di-GMP phosphodiesterase class II)